MDADGTLFGLSAGMWTAIAAWLAVMVGIAALVYGLRQYRRARQHTEELMQPNVAMFMEPAASDWHLIELVVKNFGRTPAYGIRLDFPNPPTVGKYENAYGERYVDVVPLNLPAEIPYLAPGQEWRIVWDSALDRRELGESIASRFDGAVTYYDEPGSEKKSKRSRHRFRSSAVLDWSTLHPVERLELLTTHDLARQEKQKLELLRHLLTYYHYAASESREDVLQREINQVQAAAEELRDRYRVDVSAPQSMPPPTPPPMAPSPPPQDYAPQDFAPNSMPTNFAPTHAPQHVDVDTEFEDAQTQIINGRARHRQD